MKIDIRQEDKKSHQPEYTEYVQQYFPVRQQTGYQYQ
jgi:hypothetical protein